MSRTKCFFLTLGFFALLALPLVYALATETPAGRLAGAAAFGWLGL